MTLELFDVNAMIGPLANEPDGIDSARLLRTMDSFGIAEAVVGHLWSVAYDLRTGNHRLLADIAGQPRLRPCWVVLPDTCGELGGTSRFVSEALEAGVVAFRAFPSTHGYRLASADCSDLLGALGEGGLPLLVDMQETSWPEIEAVAHEHAQLQIVACAVGYRALRQIAGVLSRTDNVSVDLSNLSTHLGLEWLAARHGAGRLIFGTGLPHRDPADAVTRLRWSELGADELAAVASSNLRRLLPARRAGRS